MDERGIKQPKKNPILNRESLVPHALGPCWWAEYTIDEAAQVRHT
jgi:hypothetical protein